MEMETENTTVEELFYKTKDYVNTRIDLFKLKAINKGSSVFSLTVSILFLVGVCLMVLLFLSAGLAFYLGEVLGSVHLGFFIVAGIYVLIGLIVFLLRKVLLKTPFSNWLIRHLMD